MATASRRQFLKQAGGAAAGALALGVTGSSGAGMKRGKQLIYEQRIWSPYVQEG